jgi:uncharacterized protein YegJ (DUF2314 family)
MRLTLLTILLIGLIACKYNTPSKTESEPANKLFIADSDDKEMNQAILKAQNTLSQFDTAYFSKKFDKRTFAIKVKMPTTNGAEHIWATDIEIKNGAYYGIIDNLPELTTKVKFGEKIKINKKDISDWMYSDKGTLRGGYTIRVIRSRMTKAEQANFDAQFQLKIKD